MASALEPLTINGRYFWKGKDRFIIKGVVYQLKRPRNNRDPIADDRIEELKRDMVLLTELGVNAIYVCEIKPAYITTNQIDSSKSHDAAMALLSEAGIYVLAGLSTGKVCINRARLLESYTPPLLEHFFATADCMSPYANTLGVLVGDHIINGAEPPAAEVIRAVTRDVKRHLASSATASISDPAGRKKKVLPVGYSAAEAAEFLRPSFDYLSAGSRDESMDFFCFSNFSWQGGSSMEESGYTRLTEQFSAAHIPVFISSYGANVPQRPRLFRETRAIYSAAAMTRAFSGAFAYEFFEGSNRYGLVAVAKPAEKAGDEEGVRELVRLGDFINFKESLCAVVDAEAVTDAEWAADKRTAGRRPEMPPVSDFWRAGLNIPASLLDRGFRT